MTSRAATSKLGVVEGESELVIIGVKVVWTVSSGGEMGNLRENPVENTGLGERDNSILAACGVDC